MNAGAIMIKFNKNHLLLKRMITQKEHLQQCGVKNEMNHY